MYILVLADAKHTEFSETELKEIKNKILNILKFCIFDLITRKAKKTNINRREFDPRPRTLP